ncbi:MAG: YIP1 family protein [Anaerolineae bacterium]|nr:YIP1 family protein [Anaerolineae bacterium]
MSVELIPLSSTPDQTTDQTIVSETEVPTRISVWKIMGGVLLRPHAMFERMHDLRRTHNWVVVLLMLVVTIAVALVSFAGRADVMPQMATTGTADSVAPATSMSSMILVSVGLSALTSIIGSVTGYFLCAVVLFGTSLIMGGKVRFRQMLAVSIWSSVPLILRQVVHAAVALVTGQTIAAGFSGVLTMSEAASMPVLNLLLGQFDIYLLWSAILLVIGVTVMARLSTGKSITVVLIYLLFAAAAAVGLNLALSALSGLFGGIGGGRGVPGMGGGPGGMGGPRF